MDLRQIFADDPEKMNVLIDLDAARKDYIDAYEMMEYCDKSNWNEYERAEKKLDIEMKRYIYKLARIGDYLN